MSLWRVPSPPKGGGIARVFALTAVLLSSVCSRTNQRLRRAIVLCSPVVVQRKFKKRQSLQRVRDVVLVVKSRPLTHAGKSVGPTTVLDPRA